MSNVIFLLSFVLVFTACNNKEDVIQSVSNEELKFEDFEKMGILHNQFLTNVKDNFIPDNNIKTREEGIEYINQFNQAFADKIDLSDSERKLLKNSLEEYKRYVDLSYLYQEAFINSTKLRSDGTCSQGLLIDNIDEAFAKDIIDEFEYENLKLIALKTKENYAGSVSDNELKLLFLHIRDEWSSKGYKENSKHGRVLAYTIAISLASVEWWEENPDAPFSDLRSTTALPAIIASDVVGAAIGAVSGGIGSYLNTGSVNWGSVGWGAGVGALTGSTGVVGKLGKWLSGI